MPWRVRQFRVSPEIKLAIAISAGMVVSAGLLAIGIMSLIKLLY